MSEKRNRPLALVTGAARGIGREVATQLAAQGYDVLVAARDASAAQGVAEEIGGRGVTLDVTDPAMIAAVVEIVQGRLTYW